MTRGSLSWHGVVMNIMTPPTGTRKDADILIERARSLVPALRDRAKETSALGKLPQATVDDFRRLGLTRCLQPAMFGGYASDYRVFSRMIRALAQGCGSSAWVAAVHGEHSWVVANFPEEAQRDMWDKDPLAVASANVAPNGSAAAVPGGHRLNGRWIFASGCDSAQWILLGSIAKGSGAPDSRMFLVPMSQVEIVDDWDVIGLRGTGSKSILLKDVMVPATHSVTIHDLKHGTAPGAKVHPDYALCHTPRQMVALFSLSSVMVGLAERAVAEFVEFNRERRSRGIRVADLESTQLMVAEASAQAETAVLVGENTIERNIQLIESGQPVGAEQIAWSRRNSAYSTQLAYSAVKLIYEAAGGNALYASNPLQEIFRDATAGAAHVSINWHRSAPYYGQIRLGQTVDIDAM
jgi:alkylation response protein AidB-like acyl-CoA dehydrogenase